eukprot:1161681-Pelagomonas_calceolata.AAC.12
MLMGAGSQCYGTMEQHSHKEPVGRKQLYAQRHTCAYRSRVYVCRYTHRMSMQNLCDMHLKDMHTHQTKNDAHTSRHTADAFVSTARSQKHHSPPRAC